VETGILMNARAAPPRMKEKTVWGDLDGTLRTAIADLVRGENSDPFALLGPHRHGKHTAVCTFLPEAEAVDVLPSEGDEPLFALARVHAAGVWLGKTAKPLGRYRLREKTAHGARVFADAYAFGPILGDMDVHLLAEGTHLHNYARLGTHPATIDGIEGFVFTVWAPNARRVSVVGDFCAWDGRLYPMRMRHDCGVWELFIPGLGANALYRFEVLAADGTLLPLKSDPHAFYAEQSPATASITFDPRTHLWADQDWMMSREQRIKLDAPVSIYEVHLGSWRRVPEQGNRYLSYSEIADQLVPYVKDMGFSHIEFMPVSEYPFDGSWGYQPVGLYAPTSRFGTPNDFRMLVERCHTAGLGVILDWVVGHFPTDPHGLVRFDGSHLYEHGDPREGFHHDWNTLIYNYGRREIRNFLLGNALFWLDHYHVDGLRVTSTPWSRNARPAPPPWRRSPRHGPVCRAPPARVVWAFATNGTWAG
jgi:1,4-alpha-glucan branching enzyme